MINCHVCKNCANIIGFGSKLSILIPGFLVGIWAATDAWKESLDTLNPQFGQGLGSWSAFRAGGSGGFDDFSYWSGLHGSYLVVVLLLHIHV